MYNKYNEYNKLRDIFICFLLFLLILADINTKLMHKHTTEMFKIHDERLKNHFDYIYDLYKSDETHYKALIVLFNNGHIEYVE